jgi:hypothetical protein
MTLDTHGFFSPDMNQFRIAVKSQEPTKAWFDYAHDFNTFALDLIRDQKTPPFSDTQRFTLAALFIRAHQSFQAAMMLAENGMIGDARAVLRTAVEGVIAMYGLAADPAFTDRLADDYRLNQRKLANVVLNEPAFTAFCRPQEIAQMQATVREVDALKAARGLNAIIWDQISAKHCSDLYPLLYRPLSMDGTHTNLDAIQRHMEVDGSGRIVGLKGGPDAGGVVEVMKFACLTVLWAVEPISRAFPCDGTQCRIQDYLRRFRDLPGGEA